MCDGQSVASIATEGRQDVTSACTAAKVISFETYCCYDAGNPEAIDRNRHIECLNSWQSGLLEKIGCICPHCGTTQNRDTIATNYDNGPPQIRAFKTG